ncbi:RNA-directed DNA polymerase, eukaryota, reverse transcriptase zinc-binding domain protein [Tanacetum coccineum]
MFSFPNALWVKVIKSLHGQEGGLDNQGCKFNDTWARIVGTSNFLYSNDIIPFNSFRFCVGCGTRIRFWKDHWLGDSPLFICYNRLYRLEQDKDCLIIDRIVNGQWKWNWSREDIGIRNTAYLRDMLLEISQLLLSLVPSTSWDKTLPHKVNIFIWRLPLDQLPHRWNLSARDIDIPSILCPSCNNNVESSSHMFFDCDFAKEVWKLVRNWCDISIPSFSSFELWKAWFDSWHTSKEKSRRISIIVAASLVYFEIS